MKQIETEHGIFTDRVNMQGDVIETAEDYYARWLKDKENKIDICDEKPSPEEQLMDMAKMILDLQYQIDVLTLLNQEG